jgi:phosphate-selective porin O/P
VSRTLLRLPGVGLLFCALSAGLAAQQAPAAGPAPAASGVRLSGYLQARTTWQKDIGLTSTLNRARLAAAGGIATDFTWRIQGEFRTGNVGTGKASVSLQDAYIRWTRHRFGVQAGQFKTPFTREFVTSLTDVETADRATVVDSLAPKRDIGFLGDYDFNKKATFQAGLFNGEGQNVTANKDSTLLGVARLVVRPNPELAVGANVARYFGDSTRFGADVNYEGPRITVRGEVVAQARDSLGGDHDLGWLLLGGFKVANQVQLVAKYEKFERPAIGSAQDNRAFTGGANFFLAGTAVRLTVEYINRKIGDPGVKAETVLAQLQVRF